MTYAATSARRFLHAKPCLRWRDEVRVGSHAYGQDRLSIRGLGWGTKTGLRCVIIDPGAPIEDCKASLAANAEYVHQLDRRRPAHPGARAQCPSDSVGEWQRSLDQAPSRHASKRRGGDPVPNRTRVLRSEPASPRARFSCSALGRLQRGCEIGIGTPPCGRQYGRFPAPTIDIQGCGAGCDDQTANANELSSGIARRSVWNSGLADERPSFHCATDAPGQPRVNSKRA